MTTCTCNAYLFSPSGGVTSGGDATVTSERIGDGGAVIGGSALVDTPYAFDGMEAVWLLDEAGDGTEDEYKDRTAHIYHGQGGGGESDYVPTQVSGLNCLYAQSFDGTDDFISLPDTDSIITSQAFTVSLWVKMDEIFKQRTFYSRGIEVADGSSDWVLSFGHTWINHVWAQLQMSDGTIHYCFSSTTLNLDKWYHIACSWNPTDGLKTYIDGELDGTNTDATGSTATLTNGSYHGKWNEGGFLLGTIQDVRLHPVERDAAWLKAEHDDYCGSLYTLGDIESAVFV